jgi:outer membrane protein with beta-barrel domain
MKKSLRLILPFLLSALPAAAQDWSLGVATGPFVFGKLAERTVRATVGGPDVSISTIKLSAATRPGLVVDVERDFNDRFALRLQGTFTDAPLAIKPDTGGGVSIDAGKIDVTTLTLPLVIRINPHGRFRFHIMGGPAYAMYRVKRVFNTVSLTPVAGTRSRFGGMAGAGLEWAWSKRFSVEGDVVDIVTSSPFEKSDFVGQGSINIPKPHNEHATVGLRLRF